jgi:hypothetical protein
MSEHSKSGDETASNPSEGTKVEKWISKLSEKPVSMGKTGGFFVAKKQMSQLEDRLNGLMISGTTTKSPSELIALHETLSKLQTDLQIAKDELDASKAEAISKSKDHDEVKRVLGAARRVLESSRQTWADEKKILVQELEQLRQAAAPLRTAALNAKRSGDPELAVAAQQEKDDNSTRIQSLHNELAKLNANRNEQEDNVHNLEKRIKELEASKKAALEHNKVIEMKYSRVTEPGAPLDPRKVDINSSVLVNVLGKKGLKWLEEADLAIRTDVRDRAYKLMQASYSSSTKSIKTFGDLFEIVFQWIKRVPHHVARKIRPWLDEIEADFKVAKLKTLKYYRETLEKVIEEKVELVKNFKPKSGEKQDDKEPFFSTVWFYGYAIVRRAKRKASSTVNSLSEKCLKFKQSFKAGFRRFLLLFKSSSKVTDDDLVYEQNEEEALLGPISIHDHVDKLPSPLDKGKGKEEEFVRPPPRKVGKLKNTFNPFASRVP